jgi:hypothetical protein
MLALFLRALLAGGFSAIVNEGSTGGWGGERKRGLSTMSPFCYQDKTNN